MRVNSYYAGSNCYLLGKIFMRVLIYFSLLLSLCGCAVHYKNLENLSPVSMPLDGTREIQYQFVRLPLLTSDDSREAVRDALISTDNSLKLKEYYGLDIPKKGVFILIEPLYKTPSLSAAVFGYISVASATILPAWSNEDGFIIKYSVYKDSKLIETFQYEQERFLALWIALLPVSWINFMTATEYDAFYNATNRFIEDFNGLNSL